MIKITTFFLLSCCICLNVVAQNKKSDLLFIKEQNFHDVSYDKRQVKFLLSSKKNPIIRYNPVSLTFGLFMYFYQKVLSAQISSGCSFQVSCSNFSTVAIKKFGLIKGIALSADRLMRCNQLAAIDVDVLDLDFKNQKIKDDISLYYFHH